MDEVNETKYVELLLSIIDYDFIRKTDKDLTNMSDILIKQLILKGKDDIIVSQKHAQLIVQNDLFDFNFYKSHYPEVANMTPNNMLNHHLIYGRNIDIVSNEHAQELTKTSDFNIDFYKSQYYSELQNMNPRQLVNHYIGFGKKERRKYKASK